MTDAEREALVERMTDAAADAYMDNEWITFTAAMRAAIRAALAVAEPVVREDEREACIATVRKALAAYGRWQGAITPETLMAKIEPAIRASSVDVADE